MGLRSKARSSAAAVRRKAAALGARLRRARASGPAAASAPARASAASLASGPASAGPPSPEAARPRALVVGSIDGACRTFGTTLDLDVVTPEEATASLSTGDYAVVIVDGGLPERRLAGLHAALAGAEARPGVLVLAEGNGRRLPWREHADEIVRTRGALRERLAAALRAGAYRREIAHARSEARQMQGQLSALTSRFAEELRLASKVQRSLLPPPLAHPRLDVAREFLPFREIGGDYYDFVPLGRSRVAFTIGDVMGKGVPAALLAANLKAALRAQLQGEEPPPAEVVSRVNRLFWDVTPTGLFATLFYGVFDLEHRRLEYVNAGHHYPFVVRPEGEVHDLSRGGTVLGLVEGSAYECATFALRPGDLLVFYSDGVTDRTNLEGELYGVERLKDAAVRSRRDSARLALYSMLGEVQSWSEGALQEDDTTLVVARLR